MTGTGDALSLSRAWYFSSSAGGRSSEKKSSRHAAAFVTKFFVIMLLQRRRPCLMCHSYRQMPIGEEGPEAVTTSQNANLSGQMQWHLGVLMTFPVLLLARRARTDASKDIEGYEMSALLTKSSSQPSRVTSGPPSSPEHCCQWPAQHTAMQGLPAEAVVLALPHLQRL